MSHPGDFLGRTGSAATADVEADKLFFCHQCNRTVTISISPSDDPFCPLCNEGFLEECESPSPNPTANVSGFMPFPDPLSSILPFFLSQSQSPNVVDLTNPGSLGSSNRPVQSDPFAFDPMVFLQNHLQNLRSSGAHVQFVIENHPSSDAGFRMPGNLGDYFVGPGLEQLIQQLAENDPNRYGPPPASKSAIDALPTVKVTDELLQSEMNQCAVCMDEFEKGSGAKQMPCKHVFHQDCLLPWLQLHNSCPVCRYELPTDDADYEVRARNGDRGGDGGSGVVVRESGEDQPPARRFSISLPWPFRRQDTNTGSGSNLGSGSGSGAGGSNTETRQEDLD